MKKVYVLVLLFSVLLSSVSYGYVLYDDVSADEYVIEDYIDDFDNDLCNIDITGRYIIPIVLDNGEYMFMSPVAKYNSKYNAFEVGFKLSKVKDRKIVPACVDTFYMKFQNKVSLKYENVDSFVVGKGGYEGLKNLYSYEDVKVRINGVTGIALTNYYLRDFIQDFITKFHEKIKYTGKETNCRFEETKSTAYRELMPIFDNDDKYIKYGWSEKEYDTVMKDAMQYLANELENTNEVKDMMYSVGFSDMYIKDVIGLMAK